MSRVRAVLLLAAAVCVLPPSATRAAESPTAEQAQRAAEVRKKLAATTTFGGFDDPEAKMDDVFAYLTRIGGVTFEINDQAFKDEMVENVGDKTIGKPLPKMADVSVETALRRVLTRIPSVSGATFVVRGGVVEITTRHNASPSSWRSSQEQISPPRVSIAFEKRELHEALQEIADATGVNVVLDTHAADKGKTGVTATLRDVAVDTAVQVLAAMADLQVVVLDDVLYVTTKNGGKGLRKEQGQRRRAAALAAQERGRSGLQSSPVAVQPEMEQLLKEREGEIRRLKAKLKRLGAAEPDMRKAQ